jgi:hypothetical protein
MTNAKVTLWFVFRDLSTLKRQSSLLLLLRSCPQVVFFLVAVDMRHCLDRNISCCHNECVIEGAWVKSRRRRRRRKGQNDAKIRLGSWKDGAGNLTPKMLFAVSASPILGQTDGGRVVVRCRLIWANKDSRFLMCPLVVELVTFERRRALWQST